MTIRVGTVVRPYNATDGTFPCRYDKTGLEPIEAVCVGIVTNVVDWTELDSPYIEVKWIQTCESGKGLSNRFHSDDLWEIGQIH